MAPSGKVNYSYAFFTTKSSPESSICSSKSTTHKVRSAVCKSAPVRSGPQLCILGSAVPRYPRRSAEQENVITPISAACVEENDTVCSAVPWPETSITSEMHHLLLNHSSQSVAARIQSASKRSTNINYSHLRSRSAAIPRQRAVISASSISKSGNSITGSAYSLTASSAGDIKSESTLDRPRGPSPPSSISTASPTCSLPEDVLESTESTSGEDEEERYSFPVPALELRQALIDKLTVKTSCITESISSSSSSNAISTQGLATAPVFASQISERNNANSIADIQEKVIELVDSQRSCAQLTWNTMKRLSATLDHLCPTQHSPVTCTTLPPPLLLEAASCARRLAQILTQLGEAHVPNEIPPLPPPMPAAVPVIKQGPTSMELQQQRAKLRHVSPIITPKISELSKHEVSLRDILLKRRESVESVSSSRVSSPVGSSTWDD